MEGTNHSVVSEFMFVGLTNSWKMQVLLFVFASVFYMASMMGNSLIIFTMVSDPHLHSPMYFLLANLSFIDLGVSCVTCPKMIYDLFRKDKAISFRGCITQIFFIHVIGGVEVVLLIGMAYDRYVAICKPLHYLTIMSAKMCIFISVAAWVVGLLHSLVQFVYIVNLPFCGQFILDSFYCDFPRFIRLACVDTNQLELMVSANSGFISVGSFFILVISYIIIIVAVQKHSSGSCKTLSTFSAHVSLVVHSLVLCYLSIHGLPPPLAWISIWIFDAVGTPFLNHVLSTLKNQKIKMAMKTVCRQLLEHGKIS